MAPKRAPHASQAALQWAIKRKEALEKAAALRATRKFTAEQIQQLNPTNDNDELDDEEDDDIPAAWWDQPKQVQEEPRVTGAKAEQKFHSQEPPGRKNNSLMNTTQTFYRREASYSDEDDEIVEEEIFQEQDDETYGDYRYDLRHNDIDSLEKPTWNSDFVDDNPFKNGFGMPSKKPVGSKPPPIKSSNKLPPPASSIPPQKRQSKEPAKKTPPPPPPKWDWGNDDVRIEPKKQPQPAAAPSKSPTKGDVLWVGEAGVVATDISKMPKWLQNKLQEREQGRLSDASEKAPVKNRRASSAGPQSPSHSAAAGARGLAAAKVDWKNWEEEEERGRPAGARYPPPAPAPAPAPPAQKSSRQSLGGDVNGVAAKRRSGSSASVRQAPAWNDGSLFGGGGGSVAPSEEPSVSARPKPPPAAPLQPKIVSNPFSAAVADAAPKFGRRANNAPGPSGPPKKKSEEDPETRQMFDKRRSRRDNRKYFMAGIAAWRLKPRVPASPPAMGGGGVTVFLRKRPIFQHEIDREEFDVVSVVGRHEVVMHNCQMHADLKRMFLKHQSFTVDAAFNETVDNRTVFETSALPLVDSVMQGGVAAMFMYGQTGSGKTHTMESIERYAVERIFNVWEDAEVQIQLAYFEIVGKRCVDLLSERRQEITLKDQPGDGGGVQLLNANEMTVDTIDDVMALIAMGKANRTTSSTHCNASSSRSHAVLRLTVFCAAPDYDDDSSEPVVTEGSLILVDCAGSERKEDSMHHNAEQRKEGAEINASLYALKECVRLRRLQQAGKQHVHVPFRHSQLTKVLMECFTRDDARLAVIGTVSPSSTDTEHSVTTLKTVMLIGGAEPGEGCSEEKEDVSRNMAIMTDGSVKEVIVKRDIPPVQWRQQDVQQWLQKTKRGAFAHLQAPPTLDGRQLVRMTPVSLGATFGDMQIGDEIYQALRAEIDRVNRARAAAK